MGQRLNNAYPQVSLEQITFLEYVMTDKDSNLDENVLAHDSDQDANGGNQVASGRRRLIKLGAATVPVVLTLASRPVLAWHCKSPSAWGSEQINPNTSLKTNPGHNSYADETWTIVNWRDNTARPAVGTASQPWTMLYNSYPKLKNDSGNLGLPGIDWDGITVARLFAKVPIARPAGLADTTTIKTVLTSGTDFQKYIICAQLNYLLLSSLNDMDLCITSEELKKMANGFYSPPNMPSVTWMEPDIVSYLHNNWFTRPS